MLAPAMKGDRRLSRCLLAALLTLTACGSPSDEELIRQRVRELYAAASDASGHQMWAMYTTSFRNACSFERMVAFQATERASSASAQLRVLDPIQVKAERQTATASYRVERRGAGGEIRGFYDHQTSLAREDDGVWRFQEQCY